MSPRFYSLVCDAGGVNSEQRLQLIRTRLNRGHANGNVTGKGLFLSAHPEAQPATVRRKRTPIRGGEARGNFTSPANAKGLSVPSEWAYRPEEKTTKEWQPKHRRQPHPLNKIAETWKGLKRVS